MTQHKPLAAWSYSRLSCYETCPKQHFYRNIEKRDEPKGLAMQRGILIHNAAAKYLSGETDTIPQSCQKFEEQFRELRTFTPIVEQKWAFTKSMRPTTWMAKDCWLRATLDAGIVYKDGWADIIDHKTGKKYDEYDDQLNLFAATMIKMNPTEVTKGVTVRMWYLDSGEEVIRDISKAEALEAFEDLKERAETMMSAERFPAKPSWKCVYCHFSSKHSVGPCKF